METYAAHWTLAPDSVNISRLNHCANPKNEQQGLSYFYLFYWFDESFNGSDWNITVGKEGGLSSSA